MSTAIGVADNVGKLSGGITAPSHLKIDILSVEPHGQASDGGAQFRAALDRQIGAREGMATGRSSGSHGSLGDKIMTRATDLASEVKKDQQYVSKMLEQATRNADSMQLMKAMMALNDYQMRVQFISKTASKAASSLDQLTKLQ